MGMALFTLQASLRKGRYSQQHLQWDSMRKTPTWYVNTYEARTGYRTDAMMVMVQGEKKMFVSDCAVSGKWFSRFMWGAKLRMGVIRRQNEALSALMVLAIVIIADEDWEGTYDEILRKQIDEVITFMLALASAEPCKEKRFL